MAKKSKTRLRPAILTAAHTLLTEARQSLLSEWDLIDLARRQVPDWKTHEVDWIVYQRTTWAGTEHPDHYATARFGIGGYLDARRHLLLKRADEQRHQDLHAEASARTCHYHLSLLITRPQGLCWINCETGEVTTSKGWQTAASTAA